MRAVNRAGNPDRIKPETTNGDDMALIVKFPCEERAATRAIATKGESAQLLFFTGVRYERAADPGAKPPRRRRRTCQQRGSKRV